MQTTTTLIIGAGQCGLAMSHELTRRAIDHVVLDAGRAGESWRSRRWDGLRLLTPNWMNKLAGDTYKGPNAGGYMTARDFAESIDGWVSDHQPPLIEGAQVNELTRHEPGYRVATSQGTFIVRSAVIATGACARPRIPHFAANLPRQIAQLSPLNYRNPEALPSGRVLVVGASASGLQIARDLARSGRPVTLAVGNHLRLPRTYRGADIMTWMHHIRAFDEPYTQIEDLERARRLPSLPLSGEPDGAMLDLNALQRLGVEVVGRMADLRGGEALFSGGLANTVALADLKMIRLLNEIDGWIAERGIAGTVGPVTRPSPTVIPDAPRLSLGLTGVQSVVWATGFDADHDFVKLPVFDRKNRMRHDGGVVEPGLYVMGLPFLRSARSVHIDGATRDARALADHLSHHLRRPLAA